MDIWRQRMPKDRYKNTAILMLAVAILSASIVSLQRTWVAEVVYLAALLPLIIAVTMIESREALADTENQADSHALRHALSHSSRLSVVGELTASIAHEINQPLAAILSNADAGEILLENLDLESDEIQKILSDIRRDGLRAGEVIRNVRTLAQKRQPELTKLDINLVVESMTELLYHEARRRRIEINVTPLSKPAFVRGDQSLLVQVLINLVVNAMDALELASAGREPERFLPAVEIKVFTTSHNEIEIRVVDQGTGIPQKQLSQLFDSFYTSKSHGMGLGLSITRSIVSAHGGRILASNNPVRGATFHIFLPPYL
jgi:signal transduction histidine kinase